MREHSFLQRCDSRRKRRAFDVDEVADGYRLAFVNQVYIEFFEVRRAVLDATTLTIDLHFMQAISDIVSPAKACRARRQHFNEAKTDFLHRSQYRIQKLPHVQYGPACDENCTGRLRQIGQIEWMLHGTQWRSRSLCADRRRWPDLTAGHAVIEIIDADNVQIDVASGSMNKMIAADRRQVTVAAYYGHIQFRFVNRDTQRKR